MQATLRHTLLSINNSPIQDAYLVEIDLADANSLGEEVFNNLMLVYRPIQMFIDSGPSLTDRSVVILEFYNENDATQMLQALSNY